MTGRRIGSLGPIGPDLVVFDAAISPGEVRQRLQSRYAVHGGALGRARLEALGEDPAEVTLPIRLVPPSTATGDAPPAHERLAALDRLRTSLAVCPLFLGSESLGAYVVESLRVTYRDPARRRIDVEVSLLEYPMPADPQSAPPEA